MVELNIQIPDAIATEVQRRLQQRYPDVVRDAVSPADGMRRVIGWWTANLLADADAEEIRTAGTAEIQDLQQSVEDRATAARAAAWERIRALLAMQADQQPAPPPDPQPPAEPTE